jgi:DMSO/TMAO reductase YedYZ molybdopterin-dependent catalytic subunit
MDYSAWTCLTPNLVKKIRTVLHYITAFTFLLAMSCSRVNKAPQKTDKDSTMHKLAQMNTPIFWTEGHPGRLDRENWKIEVKGLCDNPSIFTWQDLQKLKKTVVNGRLTSVTRWSVGGNWGGVRLSDILTYVKAKPEVKYIRFWSHGLVYDTSIPIEIALKEKTLLAWEFDDELLTEDYGGPVRAFVPYLWGYKSAKSVVRIELLDRYVPGYWEKRGYTDKAEIEAGPCRDINDDGKVKQIPDGEVTGFLK